MYVQFMSCVYWEVAALKKASNFIAKQMEASLPDILTNLDQAKGFAWPGRRQ